MRILLPVPRFDYGRPEWGDSFEFVAFVGPLERMGHEVQIFDTFDPRWRGRPDEAGRALLAAASDFEPAVVLTMLMESEVPLNAIRLLGRGAVTVNWFADDVWRFRTFSRHVAPAFSWVVTTSRRALAAYSHVPGARALYCPWGFNTEVFQPVGREGKFDVSFVGQRHGRRGRFIERLRAEGFDIEVWGAHWPRGRVATTDLARIFSVSKINLNFLESSAGPLRRLGIRVRGSTRLDGALVRFVPPPKQMKARLVEIAACGGFQLTDRLPELNDLFVEGAEVVTVEGYRDLKKKIGYYLEHEEERERIANAAYLRAVKDHSFTARFQYLFESIGLA